MKTYQKSRHFQVRLRGVDDHYRALMAEWAAGGYLGAPPELHGDATAARVVTAAGAVILFPLAPASDDEIIEIGEESETPPGGGRVNVGPVTTLAEWQDAHNRIYADADFAASVGFGEVPKRERLSPHEEAGVIEQARQYWEQFNKSGDPPATVEEVVAFWSAQKAKGLPPPSPAPRRAVIMPFKREPVSRRQLARRARAQTSRAPPAGDGDGSDDPDPDGTGANIIRAFFRFRGRAMSGEQLVLVGWKPMRKGTLVGVATVRLPLGLVIRDCPVHTVHGKAWATLPAKPQIDKEGRTLRDERGKTAYVAVLECDRRKLRADERSGPSARGCVRATQTCARRTGS